ncbi:MAG: TrkH family potassium uptake protein [Oscillospiraceae bacterium]|nr:TrkH family potassium uptake protein [Oscillospiraceae bacterium]
MNGRMICNILGMAMLAEGAFMLPALAISLFCGEGAAARAFAVTVALLLALGLPAVRLKARRRDLYARSGLAATGLTWIVLSFFGALPFWFSGAIDSFAGCLFETASGFSTTGATILTDIEALPMGLLYWRSFTNWLGGMGVLVFLLVLSPLADRNSGGSMYLLRAESPGIHASKLVPRMNRSASILYMIYTALTVLEFVLLLCGRVPVFNAVTLAFSTAGTGGFAVTNDSLASYSPYVQWVVAAFMFLFGVNFNIYFLLLIRQVRKAAKNTELRVYVCITLIAAAVIFGSTWGSCSDFEERARTALFQVASILSTTGFSTVDFSAWPELSRTVMLLLMFVGGCAGSTAGGAKVVRIQLMFKAARRSIYRTFHPNAVRLIHSDGEIVDRETVSSVCEWFLLYFIIIAASALLISADGLSMETNITAAISCINNVGPAFGSAAQNYACYSGFSQIILSLAMLIGRLEIYPILVLFLPAMYKK